jgi:hypothetical protein
MEVPIAGEDIWQIEDNPGRIVLERFGADECSDGVATAERVHSPPTRSDRI